MKDIAGIRVGVWTTGGWYDLAPVATAAEIQAWEQDCSTLDLFAAIASGTYNWTGRWAH